MTGAGTGPVVTVLAAVRAGGGTLADVAARTGLPPETVAAAVDHLVRLRRLEASPLASGCPAAPVPGPGAGPDAVPTPSCGGCPVAAPAGPAGCGYARGRILRPAAGPPPHH